MQLIKNLNENNSNQILTESIDDTNVVTDAMTAVTPPALLNKSQDYNLIQSQSTINEKIINKQLTDNQKGLNENWSCVSKILFYFIAFFFFFYNYCLIFFFRIILALIYQIHIF